ncbi:type II toxin-antitoxin system Phd/YefM family antitoxin [Candidatus Woesebacteria bacterium]|nr:type II toxin-antitoxin system Phd/YefM family antitoxin [Candidatus Woesebacteria bacterium]
MRLDIDTFKWYFKGIMNGTTVSVTDLKQNTASILKNVVKTGEPITIFQRSKPRAILADIEYFKALEEAVLNLTDSMEAERAKKEPKSLLKTYVQKRWGH